MDYAIEVFKYLALSIQLQIILAVALTLSRN